MCAGGGFTAVGDGSKGVGGFGRYSLAPVTATLPGAALAQAQVVLSSNPATAETALSLLNLPAAARGAEVLLLNILGQQLARYIADGCQRPRPVGRASGRAGCWPCLLRIMAVDGRGQPIGALPAQRLVRRRGRAAWRCRSRPAGQLA